MFCIPGEIECRKVRLLLNLLALFDTQNKECEEVNKINHFINHFTAFLPGTPG